jgi:hypothetical protein
MSEMNPGGIYGAAKTSVTPSGGYVDTPSGAAPTLTSADFGKTHIYSNATSSATYTLPAGTEGAVLTFIKTGTGTLTIQCPASTTIDDSSAAGTIYCSNTLMCSITIFAVSATKWVIEAAKNTWTTT